MNVIVVGGAESLLQGAFGQKLSQHGIQINWHEARPSRLDTLPEAAEGVLIIKDMVSHSLAGAAISLAKTKGIPFAQVTRKFSHAYPILRDTGFLTVPAAIPPAANTNPATIHQDKEHPMNYAASAPKVTADDLTEAMELIFREDPYGSQSSATVQRRVVDLLQYHPTDAEVGKLISQKMADLRNMTGKLGDPAKREYRTQLRQRWMCSYIKEYLAKHRSLPSFQEVNDEARTHFGATLEAGVIRGYFNIVNAERQAAPQPSQQPVVETPPAQQHPTYEMWDAVNKQLEQATQRIDAMNTLIQTLLEGQKAQDEAHNRLKAQTDALGTNVTDARKRLTTLENQPAPATVTVTTAPAAPSLATALAELASMGLTLKIETK